MAGGVTTISVRNILMVLVIILGLAVGLALNSAQQTVFKTPLPEVEVPTPVPPPAQPEIAPVLSPVVVYSERDVITEYLLQREQSRSAQLELLKEVASDPESATLVKQEAQKRIIELARLVELEVNVTGLLRAEGFNDPMVVASEYGVTVSIGTPVLSDTEASRIGNLVSRMSGIDPKQIVILERGRK